MRDDLSLTLHPQETMQHLTGLDEMFKKLEERSGGETCKAIKGLVKEGNRFIHAKGTEHVRGKSDLESTVAYDRKKSAN